MKPLFIVIFALFSMFGNAAWAGGTKDAPVSGVKTGYYTYVYARESQNDMPRKFHLLIEADGQMTLFGYDRYSNDNIEQYSKFTFNPDQFLGKVVTIDYTGGLHTNNKQYNVRRADGSLERVPKIRIYTINRMELAHSTVDVPPVYQYPNHDTLVMPHQVDLEPREYDFVPSDLTVSLSDYVVGKGTEDSPYTSEDGSSGLRSAIKALGGAGTILVDKGVYRVSANHIQIPVGVNIKGVSESECKFLFLKPSYTWSLMGENTIENICVDITSITRYCHTIMVDDFARNVKFSRFTMDGAFSVDSVDYRADKAVVGIGLASYVSNVTIDSCSFHNVFRGLQSKGQRSHHGITVRNSLFDGFSYTPISLDQTSDITDVVIENNKFLEFSHFGVAFARISNVTLRNNLFYSRRLAATDTFNQAIHLEDHSQRFVIEGNTIDVIMRRPNRSDYRNSAISVSDGRMITIRNNKILNSSIMMLSGETAISGYSVIEGNSLVDGTIYVGEVTDVDIVGNEISGAVSAPIIISTAELMQQPVAGVRVWNNKVVDFEDCEAVLLYGHVGNIKIWNNLFKGKNIMALKANLSCEMDCIDIHDNIFKGVKRYSVLDVSADNLSSKFAKELVHHNQISRR